MKKLFAAIFGFIKVLFTNPEKWVNENVLPSIEVVNNIKNAVDSPVAFALTAIIPGGFDDLLRAKLSTNLQKVIDAMVSLHPINNETDKYVKITKFIEWLKTQMPDTQHAIYQKMASLLSQHNDEENNVKTHAVDLLVQSTYSKIKETGHTDELTATTK
jgi:hypothetical protein